MCLCVTNCLAAFGDFPWAGFVTAPSKSTVTSSMLPTPDGQCYKMFLFKFQTNLQILRKHYSLFKAINNLLTLPNFQNMDWGCSRHNSFQINDLIFAFSPNKSFIVVTPEITKLLKFWRDHLLHSRSISFNVRFYFKATTALRQVSTYTFVAITTLRNLFWTH